MTKLSDAEILKWVTKHGWRLDQAASRITKLEERLDDIERPGEEDEPVKCRPENQKERVEDARAVLDAALAAQDVIHMLARLINWGQRRTNDRIGGCELSGTWWECRRANENARESLFEVIGFLEKELQRGEESDD